MCSEIDSDAYSVFRDRPQTLLVCFRDRLRPLLVCSEIDSDASSVSEIDQTLLVCSEIDSDL